jgi:hypothetical protein
VTISDSDLRRKLRRGCFRLPPGLSIFYIISLICKLIGFTSLASIYSQTPVLFSSVLKSTSFTPNSSPQSSLSIPDHSSPSEIRTFRCYKGTAHKLRPSPFGTHLQSPEFVILLPEPNSNLQPRFQIRVSFLPFSLKGPEHEVTLHFGIPSGRRWTNRTG